MAVYLVHFDKPFHHAKHYLGFCDDAGRDTDLAVSSRIDYHRRKKGSRLLAAVVDHGIGFEVVRVWPGATRNFERRLKGHSSTRYCPVCNVDAFRRGLNKDNDGTLRAEKEKALR
jgi:hypothetical protein